MDNPVPTTDPIEEQAEQPQARIRRPGSVTILVLGVLIITVVNLSRLILSIRYWDFLASWPGVSPWYMVLTGLIWTLAGLPLCWGLWTAKKWAPSLMQAEALTYALYFWLDRVFFMDHPMNGVEGAKQALLPVNWRFSVAATVISLVFIEWTLNRKKVKMYFGADGKLDALNKNNIDDHG